MMITVFLPLLAAGLAFILGLRLLIKIKPGHTCSKLAECDNCELLYSLAIGSVVLSFVYCMLKIKWVVVGKYPVECMGLDLYAWNGLSTAGFGLLALLCKRGVGCLHEFCDFIRLK